MASLVAPLVSGISTAASGTAEFYRQGTSTAAQVYSDAEGETQVTTHTLDARGAIVRYVEGRVDVVVKNVTGATVTSFTWGTDARDARVENLGFTGPDASGQVIAGGRTTVDAVLTDLFASLGATDGMVSVNGSPQTLSASISSSAGLVYNILAYGGVGDGVADDSAAFQAMVNAASTAGGGILYFPHGTYLIKSGVVVGAGEGKFTYLGESATGSILKQGTSGITMLALGASNANLLLGLTFTATASNTGTLVSVGAGGRATFLSCAFEPVNGTHVLLADSATAMASFANCTFSQAGASSRVVSSASAAPRAYLVACDIATAGASLTTLQSARMALTACQITLGSAVAAGATLLSSGETALTNCLLTNLFTSGTVTVCSTTLYLTGSGLLSQGMTMSLVSGGSSPVFEAGCSLSGVLLGTPAQGSSSTNRNARQSTTSGSATTYAPDIVNYAFHEVESTGASMAFSNPAIDPPPYGFSFTLLYKNTSGGNITPTFGTAYSFITAVAQVDSGKCGIYHFVTKFGLITSDFVCISPQPAGGTTL